MDDKRNMYIKMLDALLDNGYYDPSESYATQNIEILEALNSDKEDYAGGFLFKTKSNHMYASIQIDGKKDRFTLVARAPALIENDDFNHVFINQFLQKHYSPLICLYKSDDETSIISFEYCMFLPFNTDQVINMINWFDSVLVSFLSEYNNIVKQFKERQNVN